MTEIWRDIQGYEGLYKVSNLGKIKSLERYVHVKRKDGTTIQRLIKARILKDKKDQHGLPSVGLSLETEVKTKYVHDFVVNAFHRGELFLEDFYEIESGSFDWCKKSRRKKRNG